MKKIILTSSVFFFCILASFAQSSLSLNYMYLGSKEKYKIGPSKNLVDHGIGVQSKIHLKNSFYLMPDIGYFFSDYEKITLSDPSYIENKVRYYAVNANIAYNIGLVKRFFILPFAGVGYFHEYALTHVDVIGPNPQYPSTEGVYTNIIEKENAASIVCNIGLNMELYLYKNIFATAGLKYMFDIYDMKYNGFPYINAGIGYSF